MTILSSLPTAEDGHELPASATEMGSNNQEAAENLARSEASQPPVKIKPTSYVVEPRHKEGGLPLTDLRMSDPNQVRVKSKDPDFNSFDANSNGYISEQELNTLLKDPQKSLQMLNKMLLKPLAGIKD